MAGFIGCGVRLSDQEPFASQSKSIKQSSGFNTASMESHCLLLIILIINIALLDLRIITIEMNFATGVCVRRPPHL